MSIKKLLHLVTDAANGKYNFKKGAVGSNGYGFMFKDLSSNVQYVSSFGSSKVFSAGAWRDILNNLKKHEYDKEFLKDFFKCDNINDLLLAGSLKNLVPTLQFGGDELLFDIWMFVKTPNEKQFPARIYWRQSGTSIGGWPLGNIDNYTREKIFPDDFHAIINFSPFNFNDNEKNLFLDALEFALQKVPVSDFWGIFNHDLGNALMGVRNGEPFIRELGRFKEDPEAEKKVEPLLDKILTDEIGEEFTIRLLPGINKIFAIEYLKEKEDIYSVSFTTARKVLLRLEDIESMKLEIEYSK